MSKIDGIGKRGKTGKMGEAQLVGDKTDGGLATGNAGRLYARRGASLRGSHTTLCAPVR